MYGVVCSVLYIYRKEKALLWKHMAKGSCVCLLCSFAGVLFINFCHLCEWVYLCVKVALSSVLFQTQNGFICGAFNVTIYLMSAYKNIIMPCSLFVVLLCKTVHTNVNWKRYRRHLIWMSLSSGTQDFIFKYYICGMPKAF